MTGLAGNVIYILTASWMHRENEQISQIWCPITKIKIGDIFISVQPENRSFSSIREEEGAGRGEGRGGKSKLKSKLLL